MTEVRIEVLAPGLLTSIQDPGRRGMAFYGLPRSGWLDPEAAQLANRLIGNPADAAMLECNLLPPKFSFNGDCSLVLTGAAMRWRLDGSPIKRNLAVVAAAGAVLEGGPSRNGARAYVAFYGELQCSRIHSSAATDLSTGLGGFGGRRLQAGDVLTLATAQAAPRRELEPPEPEDYDLIDTIPVRRGPEWTMLSVAGQRALETGTFAVAPESNRMGARLSAPPLEASAPPDLPTVPVVPGVIQLPKSGKPIVILQDGQTTGGYPRIAVIPEAELGRFNQLRPGQEFRFRVTK